MNDTKSQKTTENRSRQGSFWCSCRFSLIIVGFFGCMNMYSLRLNMSVAMVCMTGDHSSVTSNSSSINSTNLSHGNFTVHDEHKKDGKFDWSTQTQGYIQGSFYIGYIITHLPGGWLAGRYGGKRLFGWSMLFCAGVTVLTPFAARSSVILLIGLRGFAGLCQGVTIPCLHEILSTWIPPLERSRAVGFVYAGLQFGLLVTYPLNGILCVDGIDGGWPSIFYLSGLFGVIWFVTWMLLVFDSPVSHPRISVEEKEYILDALKSEIDISEKSSKIPWLSVLTSSSVWAIIVSQTCWEWGMYSFMINIPRYMDDVLEFDIEKTGFLSSLPYLGFWVVSNLSALFADLLRKRGIMSTTTTRRLFPVLGKIIPAICIAILANVPERPNLAVTLLFIGITMSGVLFGSGFLVNAVDIAPRYAGIIVAISNCVASIGGFLAPFAIGIIAEDGTAAQWKTVFYITVGVYIFGSIFVAVFASGEVQPWALEDNLNCEISVIADKANGEIKTTD